MTVVKTQTQQVNTTVTKTTTNTQILKVTNINDDQAERIV